MIKLIFFFLLFSTKIYADDFKLKKITQGFDSPWGLSFLDRDNLLITEKTGNIKHLDLKQNKTNIINHNLKVKL